MIDFLYVNNININARTARARQVYENHCAFSNEFVGGYESFLPADSFLLKPFTSDSSRIRKVLFYLLFLLKLYSLSKSTVIYSRNLSLLKLAKKKGFETVWEAHDLPIGRNDVAIRTIAQSSYFVTISKALRNKLIEVYHIPAENIFVAHDAVDIRKYDEQRGASQIELRKELGLPSDQKIIMHTGSLFKDRGVELFETVLKELPDYIFVQVGGSESDTVYWKEFLKDYSNIMFIEHQRVEQLIKYQLSADILFYMISRETPTYWCCSPMKALEYLGSGKPIVASNIGSLSEIFNDTNSLTYDSSDKSSLVKALGSIKDNDELLRTLSVKAVEDVRADFTWAIRAKRIGIFIEERLQ